MLPVKVPVKNPFLFLPSVWWLPAISGIPWFIAALLQSLPLSLHVLPCASVYLWFSPLLIRSPVIGFRDCPNPVWPHFTLTAKILLPNKVTFWGSGKTGISEYTLQPVMLGYFFSQWKANYENNQGQVKETSETVQGKQWEMLLTTWQWGKGWNSKTRLGCFVHTTSESPNVCTLLSHQEHVYVEHCPITSFWRSLYKY